MLTPRLRSTLYVPGDRPDRFDTAAASGADSILIDLEDAVAEQAKLNARSNAVEWLSSNPDSLAWVRVNNRPDLLGDDLAALTPVANLGIVMPKANLESCAQTTLPTVALIETAVGVTQLVAIAALPNVVRLALGEADLAADLGIDPSPDHREFASIRSEVVVASAAAGLLPPTGPVFTDLRDDAMLAKTSEQLRRQGFGGRSIIHPKQIATVHNVFEPSAADVDWAQTVLRSIEEAATNNSGVAVVRGEFVDAAVARRAHGILASAGET